MNKKFLSLLSALLCMAILLSALPVALAAPANPFKDVAETAYYYDAVLWALDNNITTGTSSTAFSPDKACTRGQIVTFLWRAQGCPAPSSTTMPFEDVPDNAYYYDAVLWAVENNITTGVSKTAFGPERPCTRGQIVTFLWRSAGCPEPAATSNPFLDVQESAYYYKAVLWALEQNITTGVSKTAFGPDRPCTRGQIVTLLYRYLGNKLTISSQPKDYQMQSSMEDATFTVTVSGGTAPYTYSWFVLYDNEEVPVQPVESEEKSNTLAYSFSDYDFEDYRGIAVFCEITDAKGQKVTSKTAEVLQYVPFAIRSQPKDYQMQSSMEDATFTVTVSGGTAPYTYSWFVLYDNEEVPVQPVESQEQSNTLAYSFSDYDFEDYRGITVFCEITDANGQKLTSKTAEVLQYVPFAIRSQPKDYQMQSSMEDATFTVSVKGGAAPYTYSWFVLYDNDTVAIDPVETNETSNTLVRSFSDYDFDEYRGILVYCEITDANNDVLVTQNAEVLQNH